MPKRSFRAAMNKSKINNNNNNDSNNNSNLDNNCGKRDDLNTLASNLVSEGMPAEHRDQTEALETYYAPKELKRQIADALRETSMKKNNRPGKAADRTEKQAVSACGDKKYSKIVFNCYENSLERVGKKMVYADVVRSSPKVEKKDFCKSFQEVDNMNSENNNVTDSKKTFCKKQDVEKPLANPSSSNNNKSEVDSNKSEVISDKSEVVSESLRGCDTRDASCSVSESGTSTESLSNLLANLDPEILQELEMDEAAWEVVSIGEWSHCGSDTDEQFLLINGDVGVDTGDGSGVSDGGCGTAGAEPNGTTASETASGHSASGVLQSTSNDSKEKETEISPVDQDSKVVTTGSSAVASANIDVTSTTNKTDSSRAAINSNKSGAAGTASAPTAAQAPIKKKKVQVTRKYIGGPDLMQRLKRLGLHRVGGEEEADTMQWTGVYKTGQLIVEARRRCSLLVVSVKAECESLLLGLTCLQGLMEDTGLLSYARLNLPALLQPPK